jgi:hypothetical protein
MAGLVLTGPRAFPVLRGQDERASGLWAPVRVWLSVCLPCFQFA